MARRLNVQEQNEQTANEIRSVIAGFRANPLNHSWLIGLLQDHGCDVTRGALVELREIPEQEGSLYRGVWLTPNLRFFGFEVLVERRTGESRVEVWRDVTEETPTTVHNRGTGKSFGAIASEVFDEFLGANQSLERTRE